MRPLPLLGRSLRKRGLHTTDHFLVIGIRLPTQQMGSDGDLLSGSRFIFMFVIDCQMARSCRVARPCAKNLNAKLHTPLGQVLEPEVWRQMHRLANLVPAHSPGWRNLLCEVHLRQKCVEKKRPFVEHGVTAVAVRLSLAIHAA